MDKISIKITVFFQEPFWIGVFERIAEDKISACRITFGAEPRDYEVYDFILKKYHQLRFSPAVATAVNEVRYKPKRMQREIHKQVKKTGIGTKSQQALKLQQEQMKMERKTISRRHRQEEKQRQFQLKQQKKKEKHRGR